MDIERRSFGLVPDGQASLYTLENDAGCKACISDFGATLVEMWVPDARKEMADIVLGFDSAELYAGPYLHYLGVTTGRCGNRIRDGEFTIDGASHAVTRNYLGHHLNGGERGFGRRLWRVESAERRNGGASITLAYHSPAGEEGYPGNLDATVTFSLHAGSQMEVVMRAVSDAPTVVNMFNHSYFNLSGHGNGTIKDHVVMVTANQYLPVDNEAYIVTGEVLPVDNTPFDFRAPRSIGDAIDQTGASLDYGYVLPNGKGDEMRQVARIEDPRSGRVLDYATNNVSLHMYDGGHMPAGFKGKAGKIYGPFSGISLQTQAYPNAVNVPHFPGVVLRPGQEYLHKLVFGFSTLEKG